MTATATILPHCDRCNPNRWVYFFLNVLDPPVAIAGDYTLTFVAGSACANLPDELRTRRYAVTIEPGDLSRPSFPPPPTRPSRSPRWARHSPTASISSISTSRATTLTSRWVTTDPGITERVAPNTYLAFGGSAGGYP